MNPNTFFGGFIVGLVVMLVFLGIVLKISPETSSAYMQGQIDALSGKVLFELKEQPDKTVIWVKKESKK